jgi:magnesium-transporting ATPase (P-type)
MNRGATANHESALPPAAPETARPWNQMPVEAVLAALKNTPQGLDAHEAQRRLAAVGPNEITEGKRRTPLRMFCDQFTDFMILVLVAAAVISGLIGEAKDTIAIVVIVVLNAVIGFVQEYRADRAVEALKAMAALTATVLRDGGIVSVPASALVPGDGVNDAPALQQADIGVAMAMAGTDVAKEASAMILLDDNFATIVRAVREGRRIYDNIRRFVRYAVTTNSGEIWTMFLAPLCGLPIPLLPIQILWINLVTDGLPGLALTAEPEESNIMRRPPRPPQESIFARGLGVHVLWVGPLMAALVLGTQAWSLASASSHWQTMVFTVLCLSQLAHVLAIRSERESLFGQGLFSNLPLLGAVALTFVLQMATIYVPALNSIFKTMPLSPAELAATFAIAAVVFVAVEIEKWTKRRG